MENEDVLPHSMGRGLIRGASDCVIREGVLVERIEAVPPLIDGCLQVVHDAGPYAVFAIHMKDRAERKWGDVRPGRRAA